ncbi:MAG: agmatinase [Anaerolineae bacterium]|jgi:agmatinase
MPQQSQYTGFSPSTALGTFDHILPGSIVLVGIPSDENSSFMQGAALAPSRIREALRSGETNLSAEDGTDLGQEPRWIDLGDLELGSGEVAFGQIESAVADLLARDARVQSLGGDHAITYPILRAFAARYHDLTVLHLDAHPDLYDQFEGSRISHACPFARVMEDGLVPRLVQVGIRTMNPHQRAQADRFGVEVIEMRHWRPGLDLSLEGPLYVSIDLDVLDPAFVPGVSHHEPGGFSVRELLQLLQGLRVPVVGADIVELNPHRDAGGSTAMVAAKLLKEITAVMLRSDAVSSSAA